MEKPDRFVNYTTNTVEKDLDLFVYRKTTIDVGRYSYYRGLQSGKKKAFYIHPQIQRKPDGASAIISASQSVIRNSDLTRGRNLRWVLVCRQTLIQLV